MNVLVDFAFCKLTDEEQYVNVEITDMLDNIVPTMTLIWRPWLVSRDMIWTQFSFQLKKI